MYQKIGMHFTYHRIAQNLSISVSTAQRIYKRFESHGTVEPSYSRSKAHLHSLDEHAQLYLLGVVMENPSLYLDELCSKISEQFNMTVSPSTVCRTLHKYGISRKKIRQVAAQRCYAFRGTFMSQIFLFVRNMLVWVDETGCDNRTHIRKFGYSLIGTTPTYTRLLIRGQRYNAIAAMSCSRILALEVKNGTIDGEDFFDFIRGILIPQMLPFDGQNPHSILVLDNCTIHHISEVREVLQNSGIVTLFLPPYSPDLNPLEEAFSYVKQYLKKHDDLLQSIPNPQSIIKAAFGSITTHHLNSWISHAGYPAIT